MSQHSELVERRRKVLNAEIWAKKTASIQMIASKDGNKTWTTTYNDGSVSTEYWDRDGFKDKESLTRIETKPSMDRHKDIDSHSGEKKAEEAAPPEEAPVEESSTEEGEKTDE